MLFIDDDCCVILSTEVVLVNGLGVESPRRIFSSSLISLLKYVVFLPSEVILYPLISEGVLLIVLVDVEDVELFTVLLPVVDVVVVLLTVPDDVLLTDLPSDLITAAFFFIVLGLLVDPK